MDEDCESGDGKEGLAIILICCVSSSGGRINRLLAVTLFRQLELDPGAR